MAVRGCAEHVEQLGRERIDGSLRCLYSLEVIMHVLEVFPHEMQALNI